MSDKEGEYKPSKWSFGTLNPASTDEVPGSVLLLPKPYNHNEPLGLQNAPARSSVSNFPPSPYPLPSRLQQSQSGTQNQDAPHFEFNVQPSSASTAKSRDSEKKTTKNGIILDPQPEESKNDPLNWNKWKRDLALLCLGYYCFIGGGMTPVLAAGFTNVAQTYNISVATVSLSTGFYMLGLGFGGVLASPTAILYGKRPVYLVGAILFTISAIWCALSPNYPSLVVARIFQGIALSPCEALPSATIAEIYFLHERAYRLGIYTLLLLGGKNLMPLMSAAIIQNLGWQWVFWIVAILGAFGGCLLFLFVPETFWDRTPVPKTHHRIFSASVRSAIQHVFTPGGTNHAKEHIQEKQQPVPEIKIESTSHGDKKTIAERRRLRTVGFAEEPEKVATTSEDPMAKILIDHTNSPRDDQPKSAVAEIYGAKTPKTAKDFGEPAHDEDEDQAKRDAQQRRPSTHRDSWRVQPQGQAPDTPELHTFNSPSYAQDNFETPTEPDATVTNPAAADTEAQTPGTTASIHSTSEATPVRTGYTEHHRHGTPKTFLSNLKPFHGRLSKESWFRAALRPFILYAYPSILWSSLIYALSVGWLIVLSESITVIYRSPETYHFTALQSGLVYLSPFIGGILGTAVAGKLSDLIVRWMARRNNGVYEPEFRLVMALPILISTVAGLMGFGWAAEEKDAWIVPTVFFGVISFGCSLGSTTAITFAVDSYRQYAAEALVNLNFSKNILHGFVFSLFFTGWLESAGSKDVFLIIGGVQVACLLLTIPMFIYGKRARYMTVRWGLGEKW